MDIRTAVVQKYLYSVLSGGDVKLYYYDFLSLLSEVATA